MPESAPMITAKALGSMPQFSLEACGQKPLERALHRAGLPHRFIYSREGYISKHALATFIQEIGRSAGEDNIGLFWAPYLTVADYGTWGAYVLSAPNLGAALTRTARAIAYHSSADRIEFCTRGTFAWYGYRFGLRRHEAYSDIAFSAVGVFLSVFRRYLGEAWVPEGLLMDTAKPSGRTRADEVFGCPVYWDQPALGIVFSSELLAMPATRTGPTVTIEDVARERAGGPPRTLSDKVETVIRLHLQEGIPSVERTAKSLDIGVRSLQRELTQEGYRYRDIVNKSRVERAKELLRHGGEPISAIAFDLGYSTANNFSRAFKSLTGISPSEYAYSEQAMSLEPDGRPFR